MSASWPGCDYCGWLTWTVKKYGRVTHKHACPDRTDDFCQSHPHGEICAPVPVSGAAADTEDKR